jgi:hypothetical protein
LCRYGTSSNHDKANAMYMRNRMAMSGSASASGLHQAHLTRQWALNQGVAQVRVSTLAQKNPCNQRGGREWLPKVRGDSDGVGVAGNLVK